MKWPTDMRFRSLLAATTAGLALSACGGGNDLPPAPTMGDARPLGGQMVPDSPVRIGEPYDLSGVQYVPADIANYDAVGYASWVGSERDGQSTASGEIFRADGISAAHKTLPMPSYVEITSLDTGKTILVRINDRGPMVNDRLIDLSEGAARQLGITGTGTSAVRVRRVNPPQGERDVLRSGGQAPPRLDTPPSLLTALNKKLEGQKDAVPLTGAGAGATTTVAATPPPAPKPGTKAPAPKPTPKPAPAPTTDGGFIVENVGSARTKPAPTPKPAAATTKPAATKPAAATRVYYVQIASFSNEGRASAAAKKSGGRVDKAGSLYRVRSGPFATEAEANASLAKVKKAGFTDARVFTETR